YQGPAGRRCARHTGSPQQDTFKHTTIPEHMPSSHRRYAEWSPARMLREAEKIGPATIALFEAVMKAKPHPEQGFRSCRKVEPVSCEFEPSLWHQNTDIENSRPETGARNRSDITENQEKRASETRHRLANPRKC